MKRWGFFEVAAAVMIAAIATLVFVGCVRFAWEILKSFGDSL